MFVNTHTYVHIYISSVRMYYFAEIINIYFASYTYKLYIDLSQIPFGA